MSFPQLVTKVGFGYGPLDRYPTYTNLSGRMRGTLQIMRGRSSELEPHDAGTVTVVLGNDDSYLDPTYTGSPYWPNVKPHAPLLIQAIYAGITYDLIRASVERWPPRRLAKYVSDTTITGSDLFADFAGFRFPIHDDGDGASVGRKLMGTYNHNTNVWTNNDSYVDPNEAARVYALCDATKLTAGIANADTITYAITYTNGAGATGRNGQLQIKYPEISTHPHHRRGWQEQITMQLQGNDAVRSIQSMVWKSGKFYGDTLKIRVYGERAILPKGKGDVQLASALQYFGVPAGMLNVRRAGRTDQIPTSPWNTSLLDAIHVIAQSEIGQVYVDKSGIVQFEDRDWRYDNWGTPKTWHDGATAGTSSYIYSDIAPSFDRDRVINRWEVTRQSYGPRDAPAMQVAQTAGAKVVIVGQRSPNIVAETTALLQAQYLLARTSQAKLRIPSLTIKPLSNPDVLFPAVLGMELGDPLIVNRYIPLANGQFFLNSNQVNIEHIAHTVTPGDWTTELELSPRITTAFGA